VRLNVILENMILKGGTEEGRKRVHQRRRGRFFQMVGAANVMIQLIAHSGHHIATKHCVNQPKKTF